MADIEYKTPQDVADEKRRKAESAAYEKSLTTTEPAPAPKAPASAAKKMASGGSVSSASKRADGIAQRGKTRGKVC